MLCFELQNRPCPGWERGVWHPGAGWCAVAGAFSLPLKCSVMHQGLGWRGDGSAVRWLMQRAASGFAACSAGRCSVLRFCPCPVAWPEERIAARFSSFLTNKNCAMESTAQHFLLLALWPCVFPLVGVSGVSLRSLAGGQCFFLVGDTLLEGVSDGEVVTQ